MKKKYAGGYKELKTLKKQFLFRYLAEHPCVDCGESDIVVLEFDHIGEKSDGVSRIAMTQASMLKLENEVQKCEVRCVNCHRVKTAKEQQTFRYLYLVGDDYKKQHDTKPGSKTRTAKRSYIIEYLLNHKCVDCEETNLLVLDFDHRSGDKRHDISQFPTNNSSLRSLIEEIDKCDVRCANCHRRKTLLERTHVSYRLANIS